VHISVASPAEDGADYRVLTRLGWHDRNDKVMPLHHGGWRIHDAFNEKAMLAEGWVLLPDPMHVKRHIISDVNDYRGVARVDSSVQHERPLLCNYVDVDVLWNVWGTDLSRQNMELVVEHPCAHEDDE